MQSTACGRTNSAGIVTTSIFANATLGLRPATKMKNEITYRPDEEPGFSAILRRQAETHADFTYSLSGNVISIVDLNLWNRSLTNDIESVLRKIEHYHQARSSALKLCTAIIYPALLLLALYVPQNFFWPRFSLLYLHLFSWLL